MRASKILRPAVGVYPVGCRRFSGWLLEPARNALLGNFQPAFTSQLCVRALISMSGLSSGGRDFPHIDLSRREHFGPSRLLLVHELTSSADLLIFYRICDVLSIGSPASTYNTYIIAASLNLGLALVICLGLLLCFITIHWINLHVLANLYGSVCDVYVVSPALSIQLPEQLTAPSRPSPSF